jgi:uncharacterized protein YbbC (DUF1343 family)
MKKLTLSSVFAFVIFSGFQRHVALEINSMPEKVILPGAYQTQEYFPILTGKRVGVFANQTSAIENTHLVDSLINAGIQVTKIFGPEHGFRGTASAGEKIDSYTDAVTGIPIVSLYGKKRKPSAKDLEDVDVLIFDIQDVGVRFYTYISSLQEFMETAIDNNKPLIILDRPNPNGFYVDGPVLEKEYQSFVGMQPIPIVYGMTIGEYAGFLQGEKLLKTENNRKQNQVTVVSCQNYTHDSRYDLPIKPSPNLPDASSIYWYPSTCFFEGTTMSEGRGTEHPFVIFGHPDLPKNLFSFTPKDKPGAANPKHEGKTCYGWNLFNNNENKMPGKIHLQYLLDAYNLFPDKSQFFIQAKSGEYFFNKLAGNNQLMQQIKAGKSEKEIRESWQPKLEAFKKLRKKYLLYPDAAAL